MKKIPIYLFVILIISTAAISAPADFLIITNPDQLSILNQYEQPLTTGDKRGLLSYMPFQIIKENEILGDQVTEVVKCSYLGNTFFLMKSDNGGFVSSTHVTFQKITSCIPLGDTCEASRDFTISQKFPTHGVESTIKKGEPVIRIFQNGSTVYIFRLGKPQQYGWCTNSYLLKKIASSKNRSTPADYSDVIRKIQKRLDSANENYSAFFGYFNNMTNQGKSVPAWEMVKDNKNYYCMLKGPQSTVNQLQESTRYIVQDIEQLLLGKPFSVTYTFNQITILQR